MNFKDYLTEGNEVIKEIENYFKENKFKVKVLSLNKNILTWQIVIVEMCIILEWVAVNQFLAQLKTIIPKIR